MSIIKAPYNFVPHSPIVIFPEWNTLITHDIPFQESCSGILEIDLTTYSPLFVRNGMPKPPKNREDADTKTSEFSSFNGKKIIPGSSIKGMVRNVVEIMTYSKMGNKVNDSRYAFRDLITKKKEHDSYLSFFDVDKIYCGWLSKRDGDFFLVDCGYPGRISHQSLDDTFGTNFSSFYEGTKTIGNNKFDLNSDEHKSACFKYEKVFDGKSRTVIVNELKIDADRRVFEIDPLGDKEGILVFTGQPGPRKLKGEKWEGHHLEFIFFNSQSEGQLIARRVVDDFLFAYFEHDKNQWSLDWSYWRKKLNQGENIPVFFHKGTNGQVTALGLSYLFKLPYRNSVIQSMHGVHHEHMPDFSDVLFGYLDSGSNARGLKGRVQFEHALSENARPFDTEKKEVLASPKASYFPTYLRQVLNLNGSTSKYSTYMDDSAKVAGWKRYPVHPNGGKPKHNPPPDSKNQKIISSFIPIKEGAVFKFNVHYHNLLPVELGALLSGLTFHNNKMLFHSLGMAKPLGYGKVKLSILNLKEEDISKYLNIFHAYMDIKIPGWGKSIEMTELLSMASEQNNQGDSSLEYMKLNKGLDQNEFSIAKKNKEALKYYTKLDGITTYNINQDVSGDAKKQVYSFLEVIKKIVTSKRLITNYSSTFYESQKRILDEIKALISEKEITKELEQLQLEAGRAKEMRRFKAAQIGLDFEGINCERANAFDLLKKKIERYCQDFHGINNLTRLVKQMPNGILPDPVRNQVIEILGGIFLHLSPSEKKKWLSPDGNSFVARTITQWFGPEVFREIRASWELTI